MTISGQSPNIINNSKDNQQNSQNTIIVRKSPMFVDQNNDGIKDNESIDDPAAISNDDMETDNLVVEDKENSSENSRSESNDGLVFKITVKDGKQVLAKVHESPKKTSSTVNNSSSKSSELRDSDSDNSSEMSVKEKSKSRDSSSKKDRDSKSKSEHRDRKDREKEKDKRSSSSSHRSSSSSKPSKHSGSSSSKTTSSKSSSNSSSSKSHRSSSGSKNSDQKSSRDKDKHRSSSSSKSSSSSTKDKEKSEIARLSQAEKDKDTLAKVLPQPVNKIGKIPKKVPSGDDKSDPASTSPPKNQTAAKKPSISIEVRKDSENRPKTVKTFHSQFRSHGLAEEAPPPPSRKALKKPGAPTTLTTSTTPTPSNTAVKRSLSPTNSGKEPEKKIKVTTPTAEKPGGIKLIPAKPKRKLIFSFPKINVFAISFADYVIQLCI